MSKKRILFLLRAIGAIDHVTPVIDYLARTQENLILEILITATHKDFSDDFRINHLKNHGVQLTHILDIYKVPSCLQKVIFFFAKRTGVVSQFILHALMKLLRLSGASTQHFSDLFWKYYKNDILAIVQDHKPGYYDKMITVAKEQKLSTISLPHAADNFENYLTADEQINPNSISQSDKPIISDLVVVPSEYTGDFYIKRGIAKKEQIKILGCPRFSSTWNKKLGTLIKKQGTLPQTDNFKILFMLPKFNKNTSGEEILRTVRFVSSIPSVTLVAQPHIRNNSFMKKILDYAHICSPLISSRELIDWSDLTLFTATSAIFDNIVQDKPAIHLRRTMTNKLVLERIIKSWSVDTRDELYEKIHALMTQKISRTYSQTEREEAINQLVQPAGSDVCGIYAEAILEQIHLNSSHHSL